MKFINPIPFVQDIARSKHFYESILGLKIREDFGDFVLFEGGFALHEARSIQTTVWGDIKEPNNSYGQRNLLLYFEHDNIDAAFENIRPHAKLIHPIKKQAWGQRVFRFYDPDHHAIEIGEPQIFEQSEII